MFYEVRLLDRKNKVKKIISSQQLSRKYWDQFEAHGYDGLIKPGMSLCVESFIGKEEGREGVKLEEQVVVTEKGVERQSSYPYEMEML